MKGDFSKWCFDPKENFTGTLYQQGRVLLDTDGNAQTQIINHWQDQAARDAFGSGVAAVPASIPNSFKINSAAISEAGVGLQITHGKLWADGILAYLSENVDDPTADILRVAAYLQPPIQDEPSIVDGARDAVILELWREAFNGFQDPNNLIESALGGPDTTERAHTAMRFRLYRLEQNENCSNIRGKIQDDFTLKGKLRATLLPTTEVDRDCPVVEGGGYVGFEHQLYRIEIAKVNNTDNPPVMFKWSQMNGGLVGRGECDLADSDKKIILEANDQAIKMSGLSDFYLEVIEEDLLQGYWRVTYGAEVILDGDNLEVVTERYIETRPTGQVFFRLWNGILPITDFPKLGSDESNELRDGIRLAFDDSTSTNYTPGDYWTFEVRAGGMVNADTDSHTLIDDKPPEGIIYHRVPLATIEWETTSNQQIRAKVVEDCRKISRPLTNQGICCSFTVGDRGDYNSIQAALDNLPDANEDEDNLTDTGGEICLLPGIHKANVHIKGKKNIKIKGCDKKTKVVPRESDAPIFLVEDSSNITLEHMDIATLGGPAMVLKASEPGGLDEINIRHNRILACQQAINVYNGKNVYIQHNKIRTLDKEGADVAIFMLAENSLIERNDIGVVPAGETPTFPQPDDDTNLVDPCINPEEIYRKLYLVNSIVNIIFKIDLTKIFINFIIPFKALGGIKLAGGSERVKVIENTIQGGAGNGVTLGSDVLFEGSDEDEEVHTIESNDKTIWGYVETEDGEELKGVVITLHNNTQVFNYTTEGLGYFIFNDVEPGVYTVTFPGTDYAIKEIIVENANEFENLYRIRVVEREIDLGDMIAFLYDIKIEGNTINNMGLCGIGIPIPTLEANARPISSRLAALKRFLTRLGTPVISLQIIANKIHNCLRNPFNDTLRRVVQQRGLGGVSLGLCGDVEVHRNRIENNGVNHLTPVCGLYIIYGEEVSITHNYIVNNGPLVDNSNVEPTPGKRGGIVLRATALSILSFLKSERTGLTTPKPAVRVHDNVVDQPAGQALTIFGLGPFSILNNQFNSELSGVGTSTLEHLIGGVLIVSISGLSTNHRLRKAMYSNSNSIVNAKALPSTPNFSFSLPDGNTMFSNNQTYLGKDSESIAVQLIITSDDLSFEGNQSDMLSSGFQLNANERFAFNTLLDALTLRARGNGFKEPFDSMLKLSLYSKTTVLNNTSDNQGYHCIVAVNKESSRPVFDFNNQVIDNTFCEQAPKLSQSLISQINNLFRDAESLQAGILRDITSLQTTIRTLLQYESKRIERNFSREHPRVKRAYAGLARNFETIRHLNSEREVARIRVPEVQRDGALIHGRIVNKQNKGLLNLVAFVEDSKGKSVRSLGTTTTDTSGYYSISIDSKTLKRLQNQELFLTIRGRDDDKVLHPESRALELTPNNKQFIDIVLDRGFQPSRFVRINDGIVKPKIEVKLEDLKGVSPDVAKKLRKEGIEDVLTFVRTDDRTLQKIMGNVFYKVKKDNADLLDRVIKADKEE